MKTAILAVVALLSGCAAVINGIAPTDCYDATSSSISINGAVVRPAETVRFCPPSLRKVPSGEPKSAAPSV